jgi:hypothetical protein
MYCFVADERNSYAVRFTTINRKISLLIGCGAAFAKSDVGAKQWVAGIGIGYPAFKFVLCKRK